MNERSTLSDLGRLLTISGMKKVFLVLPGILSVIAAGFEGLSIALLLPIVQGVFTNDFASIRGSEKLTMALGYLPASWSATNQSLLLLLLVLFALAVIGKNLFRYTSVYSMSFVAYRTAHHLRKQIFTRYLTFGKLFFDRSTIGHHSTVLSTFTDQAMAPIITMDRYLNQILSTLIYLGVMFVISWKLTLFALPLFVFLHVSVTFLVKRIRALSNQIADSAKSLQKKSLEILSSIPLVLAYNTQKEEKDRYTAISDGLATQWIRNTQLNQALYPINEIETLIAILSLFAVILFVLPAGSISGPEMIVYFYMVLNAAIKFSMLLGFRSQMAMSAGAMDNILDIFKEDDKHIVPGGSRAFAGLTQGIELRHLHYQYPGGKSVLEDVSFTVEKGKMTAIVGPTGAGKTTIISLLLRYYDCAPGQILFDGSDIRDFTLESLRSHMALVSQDTQLFNDTIRANVMYGCEGISETRLQEVLEQAALNDFVKKLPHGADTLVGDRGVQLSGGEKQRLSIARALLKGSEILILDEATSSLDSQTEALIQEAINRVIKGKTAIVIAHRLSTIQHADQIVVLDQGKSVEKGTLEELRSRKGLFHALWEAQKFS
jgi:subfamily B ATP-binding cassette protein MsbA